MSGRIREEDIAYVRQHAQIDDIVGDYVQLKNAGGGQKKGLCPFHDEKSPSFHVTPARGFFHCFGCQTGGDVISFVMKMEHTGFTETVERLADRIGYQLTYIEGAKPVAQRQPLIEIHQIAATFYQEQLNQAGPAQMGRDFLRSRGFDQAAALKFSVGYAPDEWDALTKVLRGRGFSNDQLITSGVSKEGTKGLVDRFRHRLIWPIRDLSGDIVGFGARKLSTDASDTSPKYLNSPETPIYKKNQVLYGLDLAKKDIAKSRQAVIVEGYTDVMAAHLAGVTTAVATCGTAFGEEHIRILRRLLMDDDTFRGEVIFTFDGDAAGQKAALRAFEEDQKFVTQTFVAVAQDGLDPCDLRVQKGDGAVRDLIASRVPLFEFAIKSTLARYQLATPEGRVEALKIAAPLVARIRDRALRPEYVRSLSGWLGMDIDQVRSAVNAAGGGRITTTTTHRPDQSNPVVTLEREVLKSIVQGEAIEMWQQIIPEAFSAPLHRELFEELARYAPQSGEITPDIIDQIRMTAMTASTVEEGVIPVIASFLTELSVEPIRSDETNLSRYVESLIYRLREVGVSRKIEEFKSELQRIDPHEERYTALFSELIALEAQRRELHSVALGEMD